MKNKLLFLTSLQIFYFFHTVGKQTIFFKNIPDTPPEYQMVHPFLLSSTTNVKLGSFHVFYRNETNYYCEKKIRKRHECTQITCRRKDLLVPYVTAFHYLRTRRTLADPTPLDSYNQLCWVVNVSVQGVKTPFPLSRLGPRL